MAGSSPAMTENSHHRFHTRQRGNEVAKLRERGPGCCAARRQIWLPAKGGKERSRSVALSAPTNRLLCASGRPLQVSF